MMLQVYKKNAGDGLFSDADNWIAKKIPTKDDLVVLSMNEVKSSKTYVISVFQHRRITYQTRRDEGTLVRTRPLKRWK